MAQPDTNIAVFGRWHDPWMSPRYATQSGCLSFFWWKNSPKWIEIGHTQTQYDSVCTVDGAIHLGSHRSHTASCKWHSTQKIIEIRQFTLDNINARAHTHTCRPSTVDGAILLGREKKHSVLQMACSPGKVRCDLDTKLEEINLLWAHTKMDAYSSWAPLKHWIDSGNSKQ